MRAFAPNTGCRIRCSPIPTNEAIRAYGVLGPFGFSVRRATFLIGRDGKIRDVIRADLRVARHHGFLKRTLGQ